uniref:Fatty acid desaturase domain-containing protein n=1 Tax=Kalanchoe fedtschenkoi TaxID=63787 RepID=A0A7N0RF19_KALFE
MERKPRPFWGRRWHPSDVFKLAVLAAMHMLCLFAPFCFTWPAFWVGAALSVVTGLFGITLSYHRNLTHKSFTLPKWLEYAFAYCGVLALEGDPIDWVSTHRYHHRFTDSSKDPHSPVEGFWFSHVGWILDRGYLTEKCGQASNVSDLRKQIFYRFIEKTYYFHALAPVPVLYLAGGFPFVVWGLGVRVVVVRHATWTVNSVCHRWGTRDWDTGDMSRNNWFIALLTFGEGWHNNHHAFEWSARHGLEWWQVDATWGVIRLLEAAGLAADVKLPSEAHKKMAFQR